jgi:hypothetical protein
MYASELRTSGLGAVVALLFGAGIGSAGTTSTMLVERPL